MRQTGSVGEVLCPVLVGRQAEIQALELALDGALADRGGCAVITGEAGIGKSRLMRELSRMAGGPDAPPGPPRRNSAGRSWRAAPGTCRCRGAAGTVVAAVPNPGPGPAVTA